MPLRPCALASVRPAARFSCASALALTSACASPFDAPPIAPLSDSAATPADVETMPASCYRAADASSADGAAAPALDAASSLDDYIRYALYTSPAVEAAYQRWRALAEELPQVSALPDPRVNVGFFLDEVETRVGPQQARIGVSQTFPWFGKLADRKDAAARAAMAAWRDLQAEQLALAERVASALYELAYLDRALAITRENLDLVRSFEAVVRARYRVGVESHPALIRAQVELGQLEDRLANLASSRPAFVAELNAALHRSARAPVPTTPTLPQPVVDADPDALIDTALEHNPSLLALDEQVEAQRILTRVARKDGLPDFTIGVDYIITDDAIDPSITESGDDPIVLNFGVNVPLWRDKYEAGVREARARMLAFAHTRASESDRIAAAIERAWFEHTDAHRRATLYETTLIPKAQQSLRASLAGFRAGDASFLDLLDTERTLLEFALIAQRARADRSQALARLTRLVGGAIPVKPALASDTQTSSTPEVDP